MTAERPRITRRRFLPAAAGVLGGAVAAGAVGYELRGSDHAVTKPTSAGKPSSTAAANPAPISPFVTRPDLRPPTVRITPQTDKPAASNAPRFVALAADNVTSDQSVHQAGVMLFDRQGRLVWFEPLATTAEKPFDLNVQSRDGKAVLAWWQGHIVGTHGVGRDVIIDSTYKTVQTISSVGGLPADLHEFVLTSRGTALMTAYSNTSTDLRPVGGKRNGAVANGHVFEIELASGKVLLDWNALEHIPVQDTYKPTPSPNAPYDYFHLNGISETPDGNLLICSRNTWTVYKVDRSTGKIIWRLGGKRSDFKIESTAAFQWQHHATWHGSSSMTLFDNAGTSRGLPSRGLLLSVDEQAMSASLTHEYTHPARFVAGTLGSVQLLANGNVFVGWGSQPYFSEFNNDGMMLWDAELPIGMRSYRAFLVDWVGRPTDPPLLVVKENPAGGLVAYVGWNGATEVARWRILAGARKTALSPIAEQAWAGLETPIVMQEGGAHFQAVALDAHGNELGRSAIA